MTGLLLLQLDQDLAGHLAVALRRHRGSLDRQGLVEPPGLVELEAVAQRVAGGHEQSRAVSGAAPIDDGWYDLEYLSRDDIRRRTGASLSTVDRWIGSGELPLSKHGRVRRVARADLAEFLAA